ncbi:hypothetical protein EUV02_05415 [Polymorphobacter arshaanensis]|uniref:Uncharacterized protein n=1 Tax=Glacieibacterium arshaanense TaxID=2511025 RepID=A0A4Y9ES14_9SPHN|nr:hypothetical protein [Polymorphobacter arshaanensis]TFU06427.1 hypothetical protein EUV02_05415 [Polymorphobacter arshaanensis]
MIGKSTLQIEVWRVVVGLVLLGIFTSIFGYHITRSLIMILVPMSVILTTLKQDKVIFLFGRHDLVRSTNPLGFWAFIGFFSLVFAMGVWLFVDELLQAIPS